MWQGCWAIIDCASPSFVKAFLEDMRTAKERRWLAVHEGTMAPVAQRQSFKKSHSCQPLGAKHTKTREWAQSNSMRDVRGTTRARTTFVSHIITLSVVNKQDKNMTNHWHLSKAKSFLGKYLKTGTDDICFLFRTKAQYYLLNYTIPIILPF